MMVDEKRFGRCLVITRHQLLSLQEADISTICGQYTVVPEFPQTPQEQKQLVQGYDAIIGTLPVNLIQSVQSLGKVYITFVMKSLGTYSNQNEINRIISQYGEDRVAVLPPSKPSEPYRVTLYQGLKTVKVIVEETPIITHE
jgi:hypothetical protein